MDNIEVGTMREFFAKVVDQVNELSAQAGLVSGLQQQVNELRDRISQLENQNYQLQQSLNDANGALAQRQGELESVNDSYRRATEHADALRHTIVEADA